MTKRRMSGCLRVANTATPPIAATETSWIKTMWSSAGRRKSIMKECPWMIRRTARVGVLFRMAQGGR